MDNPAFPILLMILGALGLAVGLLVLGALMGPKRNSAVKQMPYESGMDPIHDARRRFDVRYYLVAIAFLLFDVELLFLYPWAVVSRDLGLYGFAAISVFVGVILIGYLYELGRGAFKWD